MEKVASLKIQSNLKNLKDIRSFIKQSAEKIGLPEKVMSEIRLAVDEACANIIIHGYKDADGDLEILVNHQGKRMIVTLNDNAPKFNPLQGIHSSDFDVPLIERPLGGMGLFLVKENADSVEYKSTPSGGNSLILTKHF